MSKPKRRFKYDPQDGLMPEILRIIAPPTTEIPHATRRELNEAKRAEKLEQETWKNVESQICSFCYAGGNILCCEECPASFHLSCIGINEQDVPDGVWLCNRCQHIPAHLKCSHQPTSSANNNQFPSPNLRAEREKQRNDDAIRAHLAIQLEKCKDLDVFPNPDIIKVFTYVNPVEFVLSKKLLKDSMAMPNDNVEKARPEIVDKMCQICLKRNPYSPMLKCDYCPRIYHKDCIDPPLTVLPIWRKWMCPRHVENTVDVSMGGRIMVNSIRRNEWSKYINEVDLSSQSMDNLFMELSRMAISVREELLMVECEKFQKKKIELITPYHLPEDIPSTSSGDILENVEMTGGKSCVSIVLVNKALKGRKNNARVKKTACKYKQLDHAYEFTNCSKPPKYVEEEREERSDPELDELDKIRSIPMSQEELERSIISGNAEVRRSQRESCLSEGTIPNMRDIVAMHDNVMARNAMLAALTEEQEMINRQWQSLNVSSDIRGASIDYYAPKFRGKEEKGKRRVVAEGDLQLLAHGYGNGQHDRRFSSFETEMFYQRCPPPLPARKFSSQNALRHIILSSQRGISDFSNSYMMYASTKGLHNTILLMYDHSFKSRENRDTFYVSSMSYWSKEPFVQLMEKWRSNHIDEPAVVVKIENPEIFNSKETSKESSVEPQNDMECEDVEPQKIEPQLDENTEPSDIIDVEKIEEPLENGTTKQNGHAETPSTSESPEAPLENIPIDENPICRGDEIRMDSDEFWKDTFIIPPINSCRDSGDIFENLKIILPKWQMDAILPNRSNVYRTSNNLVVVRYGRNPDVVVQSSPSPEICELMAMKHHPDFYEKFPECVLKREMSNDADQKTHIDLTIDEVVARVRVEEGMSRHMEKRFARYLEIQFDLPNANGVENTFPSTPTCTSKDETYCSLASSSVSNQCPFHGTVPPIPATNGHTKFRKPRYKFLHPILRDHDYAPPPPGFDYRIDDPLFPTSNEFCVGFFEPYEMSGPLTPGMNGIVDRTVPLRGMYPRKRGRPPGSKNKIREDEFGNPIKKRKNMDEQFSIDDDGSPVKRRRGRPKGSSSKKGSSTKKEKKLNGSYSSDEDDEEERNKSEEKLKQLRLKVLQVKQRYSSMMVGLLAQLDKNDYLKTREEAIQHWSDSQWEQLNSRYIEERAQSLFPFETRFLLPNVTVWGYLSVKSPSIPLPFAIQRGLTKLGSAHDCHIRIDRFSKAYCDAIQDYHCDIVFDKLGKSFYLSTLAHSSVIVDETVIFRKKLQSNEIATRSRLKGKESSPVKTSCHCELELSRLKVIQKQENRRIDTGVVALKNKSTIRIGCVTLEITFPEKW